mmetsp:Transcript_16696/g.23355  ORF Transcript_16696/g.23355 Transcript_16696/m.23355 type:complete len:80 (+) Transcript_16696:146-385(+)|eukprot:CAMPEP_0184488348 /NCGR_PEP_ID=MMETSP0113_2-20130426/11416_1 /TAXON_ID=91329 /ORGANISM="Norrisiella sphaerica, Strain BC52" /LENGTH=79 /DNA_ID=CAMNT_0026871003 /DNA_START=76 /DNA_END=315 /DNA_ORIENTATION=+
MAEVKTRPDMKKIVSDMDKVKLKKNNVKHESPAISDHTKLMYSLKSPKKLGDASEHLKKAEEATRKATLAAYNADKKGK